MAREPDVALLMAAYGSQTIVRLYFKENVYSDSFDLHINLYYYIKAQLFLSASVCFTFQLSVRYTATEKPNDGLGPNLAGRFLLPRRWF